MSEDSEDKPIIRRECDNCALRVEVKNVKIWQTTWDGRFWGVLILSFFNLLGVVGTLILLLAQKAPAVAAVVGK